MVCCRPFGLPNLPPTEFRDRNWMGSAQHKGLREAALVQAMGATNPGFWLPRPEERNPMMTLRIKRGFKEMKC